MAGLHLRWNGIWQRPNHVLARVARQLPVIVVEEPLSATRDDDVVETRDGVTVLTPQRSNPASDALDERTVATVRCAVGGRVPLIWLYTPMMLALADAFPGGPLIFDKMDELAKFAGADARIAPREDALLARAHMVFTGGRSLQQTVALRFPNAACYPSGVDVDHFARARASTVHPALRAYRDRPVLGYVGAIDERLDLALIDALAVALPGAVVAMVGPVVKIDASTVPQRPNIVYLGTRTYEELPSLLAGFDVALMPFALNEHTRNISPTKTLEYLAAGLPIVSTAIADVVADHADVVHVARDAREFIELVRRAHPRDQNADARAAEKARAATWDAIVAAMLRDLEATSIRFPALAQSASG